MLDSGSTARNAATALLAALSLLLTGCFVTPGKFDSTLILGNDNSFTYIYNGEVFFFALSPGSLSDSDDEEFSPSDCFDEDTYEDRECTQAEITEQRAEWNEGAADRKRKKERDAQEAARFLGGLDPNDPEAGNKMAAMLERQRGWNSVVYKGDGVFNVEYSVSGMLSHDFSFPVMEGVPLPSPFMQVILREGDQLRVNAPGFAMQEGGNPMTGMMMGGFAQGLKEAAAGEGTDSKKGIPEMAGTFRIITNGRILANNTDEGPSIEATRQTLTWDISPSTSSAPTALIQLGE